MDILTDKELAELRDAGVATLPSNPSKHGMSEAEIKAHYTKPQVLLFNWLKAFEEQAVEGIDRVTNDAASYTAVRFNELKGYVDSYKAVNDSRSLRIEAGVSTNASNINAETSRAVEAEEALGSKIDSKSADALSEAKEYADSVRTEAFEYADERDSTLDAIVLSEAKRFAKEYANGMCRSVVMDAVETDKIRFSQGGIGSDSFVIRAIENEGLKDVSGKVIDFSSLKVGDVLYLTQLDVPDYFVADAFLNHSTYEVELTFYKMETTKVNLGAYATEQYADDSATEALEEAKEYADGVRRDAFEYADQRDNVLDALVLSEAKAFASEVASGKCKSFVMDKSETDRIYYGPQTTKIGSDTWTLYLDATHNTDLKDVSGNVIDWSSLEVGDVLYLKQTDVPDYFVGDKTAFTIVFYKMETTKVNIDGFLEKVTSKTNFNQVYGKSWDGKVQNMVDLDEPSVASVGGGRIAVRHTNGNIRLPAQSNLIDGDYAVSKGYVDSLFEDCTNSATWNEIPNLQVLAKSITRIGRTVFFYAALVTTGDVAGTVLVTIPEAIRPAGVHSYSALSNVYGIKYTSLFAGEAKVPSMGSGQRWTINTFWTI